MSEEDDKDAAYKAVREVANHIASETLLDSTFADLCEAVKQLEFMGYRVYVKPGWYTNQLGHIITRHDVDVKTCTHVAKHEYTREYGVDKAESQDRHECPDWDYLEIDENSAEYEACLCNKKEK